MKSEFYVKWVVVTFDAERMFSIREPYHEWNVDEYTNSPEFDDVSAIHDVCCVVCPIISIPQEYEDCRNL